MKKLLLAAVLLLSACTPQTMTKQVTNFDECVAAGNPVMESYPRQCNHEGQRFVEDVAPIEVDPNPVEANPDRKPCTRDYRPVCGEVEVQCVKAPCPPLKTTFSNECEAENAGAKNLVPGECVDEEVNPEGACLSFDGNWLEESQECEGMAKEQCETLGGTHNECASACRNQPDAQICTLQCVIVCQF